MAHLVLYDQLEVGAIIWQKKRLPPSWFSFPLYSARWDLTPLFTQKNQKYLNHGVVGWKLSDKLILCRDLGRTIYLRHKKRRRGWKSSRKFSIISYREQQVNSRSNATLKHHNSGLKRAFDKIPKPNLIYWEVTISSDGQNKSIPLDLGVQLSYNLRQRLFKR